MTEGVILLEISKEDIVDSMSTFELPEKTREWIRNQDDEVIHDCIRHATRHFCFDYYYDAICDTLEELQKKHLKETREASGDTSD